MRPSNIANICIFPSAIPKRSGHTKQKERRTLYVCWLCLFFCGSLWLNSALARSVSLKRTAVFDIPAQPLESALVAFGKQARVQIIISPDLAAGVDAPAVKASMQVEAALADLLRPSGLDYKQF